MPTSNPEIFPAVVRAVMAAKPKSVLDIGCGFGKYGLALREYLELWDQPTARYDLPAWTPPHWRMQIVGVEAHGPLAKWCRSLGVYTKIVESDATTFLSRLGANEEFDCAICVAVLEHLDKPAGKTLLDLIERKSRVSVVAVPRFFTEQGPIFGNPHEQHRSEWDGQELQRANYKVSVVDRTLVGVRGGQ